MMATRSACRIWTDAPEAGVEGPHMSGSSPECLAIEGLAGFRTAPPASTAQTGTAAVTGSVSAAPRAAR